MKVVSLFAFLLLASTSSFAQGFPAQAGIRCQDYFSENNFRGMEFYTVELTAPDESADKTRELKGRLHYQIDHISRTLMIQESNLESYRKIVWSGYHPGERLEARFLNYDEIPNRFTVKFKSMESPRQESCYCKIETNAQSQKVTMCGFN